MKASYKWPIVSLAELAKNIPNAIVDGPFGSNLKISDYISDGIPVLQGKNITGNKFVWDDVRFISFAKAEELKRSAVNEGDILIVKIGSIGYSGLLDNLHGYPFAIIPANLCKVTIDENKVYKPYLLHYLKSELATSYLINNASATAQPALSLEKIKKLPVIFPPYDEQRRIAQVLDKADRLRRLRRHATQQTDTFFQSVFVEMFAGEESRSWPTSTVEDVALNIRTGPFGSQLLHSEFVDEGIAVLGIDNAVNNRFVWAERRYITPEKYEELRRYTVQPGDVLITIMGTCGRCAVVPDDIPLAINTKHLCCITLEQKKCLPSYLHACFLNHPTVLAQLGGSQRGAIMDGLNMGIIKELKIPLPPMDLQKRFYQIVNRHNSLLNQNRESERQAELLFQTLLYQAFARELVPA